MYEIPEKLKLNKNKKKGLIKEFFVIIYMYFQPMPHAGNILQLF